MIRLALRVRREDAELALAELLALAPAGVEELEVDDALIEFAVYGAPGELPELPDLRAAAGSALVDVSTSELPDDWGERWKRFHRPILIESPGGGVPALRVRPPWEPAADPPAASTPPVASTLPAATTRTAASAPTAAIAAKEIVIDPGQAFGTGAHHTTRMCLELLFALASHEPERGPAVDIGCGSGVLAIAASHLGFAPVLALDHESESVLAARENAQANGVAVDVRRLDLRREPLPALEGQPAPILLANLVRPLLLELATSLAGPPRHLIAGGLLREEADEVAAAFHGRLGLGERERRHGGEWTALWLSSRV